MSPQTHSPPEPRRTGTIQRYAPPKAGEALGHYVVRCSAPDGTRPLFHLDPSPESPEDELAARAAAEEITADLWAKKLGAAPRGSKPEEPPDVAGMAAWLKGWMDDRKRRGYTSTRENDSHYRLHIAPSTGQAHVRDWNRDTMRKLSRDLDAKVQGGAMAWKMAWNVWGTATKMCDDAAESKDDEIKCRDDNPSDGVRGPDRGAELGLQFLYPSEFLQFVSCEEVPLRWRRLVAIAVYLYPRDSELRALECRDVDTEHLMVMITRALDRDRKGTKSTKGKRVRPVPVEPPLVALLEALKAERGNEGRLLAETPSERDLARGLRRWLWNAGVRRYELHNDTETTRKLRFHDLRSTGVTWLAVRGDDALKIQQRAGHREFSTTQKYIRLAEMHGAAFGKVFPELPESLLKAESPKGAPPPGRARSPKTRKARDSGSVTRAVTGLLTIENRCGADGTRTRDLDHDPAGIMLDCDASPEPVTVNSDEQVADSYPARGGKWQVRRLWARALDASLTARAAELVSDLQRVETDAGDAVEQALAGAVAAAAAAGRWQVVESLARELEARRRARAGVLSIDTARARKGPSR